MPDTVRAKVVCSHTAAAADGSVTAYMSAVYSDDPNSENKKFSDATPNLHLTISIKAGGPTDYYVPGRQYYLDFIKAD